MQPWPPSQLRHTSYWELKHHIKSNTALYITNGLKHTSYWNLYLKGVVKELLVDQTSLSHFYSSLAANKSELLILVAAVPIYLLILFNCKKLGQQLISGCCFTCSE